jgi:hypothetical protein
MIYAHFNGVPMPAFPDAAATCPICRQSVRAKCGQIITWHWAHISTVDCDTWAEADSEWHRSWQNLVPVERREVTIGNHRADILTADGGVVEVQHSTLSPDEIREREDFYGLRMCWIFDATNAFTEERIDLRRKPNSDPNYRTFRWKHPRKSIGACRRPVFLDLGDDQILRIGRIHLTTPCGGWGHRLTRQDLANAFNEVPR